MNRIRGDLEMYELTPLNSILRGVNVVRAGKLTKILDNNVPYKKLIDLVGDKYHSEINFFNNN